MPLVRAQIPLTEFSGVPAYIPYIGFNLWHVHFLHELNPINAPVPVPVVTNPAAAIPNAINAGLARGGIVVGNIATEVFQYAVPGLFVMGSISSAIREQKMKRRKWGGMP